MYIVTHLKMIGTKHTITNKNMEEKITAWIARDKDGELHLYSHKPHRISHGVWFSGKIYSDIMLPESLLSQIKEEDEEPAKVELTIKICE